MSWDKIKNFLTGKSITLTTEEEEQLKKELTPPQPAPQPAPQAGGNAGTPELSELKLMIAEQNKKIDAMSGIIQKEQEARLAAEKQLAERAKTELKTKIDTKIEEMKKNGQIPAKNDEMEKSWRKQLETDFETTDKIIANLPKQPAAPTPGTPGSPAAKSAENLLPDDRRMQIMTAAKEAFKTNISN